jgi:phosphatidylserine synthase 2
MYQTAQKPTNNVLWGLGAALAAFVVYGALQFRDGPFIRPHPLMWRVVTAVCVAYFVLLVFLLFQDLNTVRKEWLPMLDPDLGKPLEEKSYGGECGLYTPDTVGCQDGIWSDCFKEIKDKVWDEFMLAHFLGWFGKAIIMRSWVCAFMSGILFELFELTFDNWMPNFTECWWDHLILDLFGCNLLGIICGFYVCHCFQMKKYEWQGISKIKTRRGQVKRLLGQFMPMTVEKAPGLRSMKGLFSVFLIASGVALVDLSAFLFKALLWLEPPHKFNLVRILIWWLLGIIAIREFYSYVGEIHQDVHKGDEHVKRFGQHSWLALACCSLELAVCWRWINAERDFNPNSTFHKPFKPYVIELWFVGALTISAIAFVVYAPVCEPIRLQLRPIRKYFNRNIFGSKSEAYKAS